jgi:carotenoid cleavage dioxygenase-like enzyme
LLSIVPFNRWFHLLWSNLMPSIHSTSGAVEHLFIPEPGTSPGGAGWVLGTALDLKQRCTVLACFRADRLTD